MGNRKAKRGKSAKLARKGVNNAESEEIVKAPHSFVINRGKLGKNYNELLLNFRKLMEPFTASHLKAQRQNNLKDFIDIAGPLNVTHLVIFTKSESGMYFRIAKLPHGPTLTYQVKEYSLVRDIISAQKKPLVYEKLFEHQPLLVLNGFSGEGMHLKLMTTTFQNMFPSINVNKTNLNAIRRTLLINYNEDKTIDLRQYAIKIAPTGMSRPVKKLIQSKVPNLSQYKDIEDFLQGSGNLSESEYEQDTPANTVVLPQPISSRGNITSEKSSIRLFELGPRIKLQLMKIEEGVMTGEVLYHDYITKTPEEIAALRAKMKAKKHLKEQRKAQQKKNVERKKKEQKGKGAGPENPEEEENKEDSGEEDVEYYRQEVGEEPDESELPIIRKRRMNKGKNMRPSKRVKFSEDANQQNSSPGKKGKFFRSKQKQPPGVKAPMKNKKFAGKSAGSGKFKNKFSKTRN